LKQPEGRAPVRQFASPPDRPPAGFGLGAPLKAFKRHAKKFENCSAAS
jgi:hypothetical protein